MLNNKKLFFLFLILISFTGQTQIRSISDSIKLKFVSPDTLYVIQKSICVNGNNKAVDTLFFYVWMKSLSSKKTPLAKRFLENYEMNFHFARKKRLSDIQIDSLLINGKMQKISYLKNHPDILSIALSQKIKPKDSFIIFSSYRIKLPDKKFTGIGIDKKKNILLKDFYLSPLPYSYQKYSNLNLNDRQEFPRKIFIQTSGFPSQKNIYSNLTYQHPILFSDKSSQPVILITDKTYEQFQWENKNIFLPENNKIITEWKKNIIEKVMKFYQKELGEFPEKNILITKIDYKQKPIYDIGLLPSFINPITPEIRYEMNFVHQLGIQYANKMIMDIRKNPWIYFGISFYPEFDYINKYYANFKLLGKISEYKLVKLYYLSQLKMTDKFSYYYLFMARMNKDQKLNTPLSQLANFNLKVGSPAKMVLGMQMLKKENPQSFEQALFNFYKFSLQNETYPQNFYNFFRIDSLHWFREYINSRIKYDYKLRKITQNKDKYRLQIRNKTAGKIPLEIIGLKKNKIVYKKLINGFVQDTTVYIDKKKSLDWIGINYFNQFPEIQTHNNYKPTNPLNLGKPLQIRLIQDASNPLKNQIFINPFFEYNYYDGIILGTQIHNAKILHNNFEYSFSPGYATKAKTLSGSFSANYRQYFVNMKPYEIKYGISADYYHYNHGLIYKKINPYIDVQLRSPNIRKRKGTDFILNYLNISKENFPEINPEQSQYAILNFRFQNFNVNVLKDRFSEIDLQLSKKFGKLSAKYRFRWLSDKKRQWDFRVFAGIFLYNHTQTDYFSYALDRPTDYLFRYNYYGRSERVGIFHQQFIWAEGGFKTFFPQQFANQWLISNNLNIGIWKWFGLYGDWAFKKSKKISPEFYYDSGLHINGIQDYFEVFLPVYSTMGNELKDKEYYKKIRLIFTIDLQKLSKMFRRNWY